MPPTKHQCRVHLPLRDDLLLSLSSGHTLGQIKLYVSSWLGIETHNLFSLKYSRQGISVWVDEKSTFLQFVRENVSATFYFAPKFLSPKLIPIFAQNPKSLHFLLEFIFVIFNLDDRYPPNIKAKVSLLMLGSEDSSLIRGNVFTSQNCKKELWGANLREETKTEIIKQIMEHSTLQIEFYDSFIGDFCFSFGLSLEGVFLYLETTRIFKFEWSSISVIKVKGRQICVKTKSKTLNFKFHKIDQAKTIWKRSLQLHNFYIHYEHFLE